MLPSKKIISLWEEVPYKFSVYASFTTALLLGIAILTLQNFLPPIIPLFYGKPTGTGELTSLYGFLIAPLTSLLVTIVNLGFSFVFKDEFTKKILVLSALFVSILLAVTVIKIILLVGFF